MPRVVYTCTPVSIEAGRFRVEAVPVEDIVVCLVEGREAQARYRCKLYTIGPRGAKHIGDYAKHPWEVDAIVRVVNVGPARLVIADFQRRVELLYEFRSGRASGSAYAEAGPISVGGAEALALVESIDPVFRLEHDEEIVYSMIVSQEKTVHASMDHVLKRVVGKGGSARLAYHISRGGRWTMMSVYTLYAPAFGVRVLDSRVCVDGNCVTSRCVAGVSQVSG